MLIAHEKLLKSTEAQSRESLSPQVALQKKIGLRGTERSCHKHLESKIRSQLLHHLPPPPTHEGGVNPGAFKPLRKFKNKIREAIYGEISNSECSH